MSFSSKDFDRFFSESSTDFHWVLMHPSVWNGYWYIDGKSVFSDFYRWLGRKLNSRRIYWLGLRIRWMTGLRYYDGNDFGEGELIDMDKVL